MTRILICLAIALVASGCNLDGDESKAAAKPPHHVVIHNNNPVNPCDINPFSC